MPYHDLVMHVLSCSGPGAPYVIAMNQQIGINSLLGQFGYLAMLVALSVLIGTSRKYIVLPIISMIIHPVWYDRGSSGDCGNSLGGLSILISFVSIVVFYLILIEEFRMISADPAVSLDEIADEARSTG